MRIALLSCFYPFRGGISQFNASLYLELGKSHTVKAFNFTRQYPEFLFPGKTQYVTKDDDAVPIESDALLDTANPFTYGRTYRAIRDWEPDLVIISYWMSYFAPSLGYIARRLRKRCKVISILHNVVPHEPRFFDAPLTRYFLSGCTGNVTLCDEVAEDLKRLSPKALNITLFHPIYGHFGEKMPREEAEKALGLKPGMRNLLFFGLIRDYKGLDILLDAFGKLDSGYQLIVAGEPYGSFVKYRNIIDRSPAKDRIRLFTRYIKDSEVKVFFSASDLAVLPYRSATQSGISAIAYHFEVPMVVTDVGGLRQSIGDCGTGLVAPKADADCVVREIRTYFSDANLKTLCVNSIKAEKDRLSWRTFSKRLLEFSDNLYKKI
ncbi:MAG: glycosyltransferase [Candidatus Cryptobacteroides sp.]|nr:glycosyltransferase [Alistipes sp.]MDY4725034.1 glycosyltransferase [Candidatus Cryptobacteroides sp.]MDY5200177.1 glycosyltransferase [Candidatus Cryptobacteroides sp.]